jgi:hypothetical protein
MKELRCEDCDRLIAFKVCAHCMLTDRVLCPQCMTQREGRNKAYWEKETPETRLAAFQMVIDSWNTESGLVAKDIIDTKVMR